MAPKKKRRKSSRPVSVPIGTVPTIVDRLPDNAKACIELGKALEQRREFSRASRVFGRAAKLAPRDAMAHAHHGYALGRTLAMEEAVAAHTRACHLAADSAEVIARHGQMLMDNDLHDEAIPVLQRAIAMNAALGDAHMNLCWALRRTGQLELAISHGKTACATSTDPDAAFYLIFSMMAANRANEALEVCKAMLDRDPRSVPALSLMVSALEQCGHRDEGRWLADFDRLVVNAELKAPPGYDSIETFNAELARLIVDAPGRPLDRTQTLDIFERPEGAIHSLWQVFNEAAQTYFEMLPDDPAHPFMRSRPKRWALDGWGNRVRGNPEQEHHFHHHGWLSGVYYVQVPEFVNAQDAGIDGCIEFCRFNAFTNKPVESEFMVLRPQPGTLALFPSYVYHRVCAYEGKERRISIAFNLTPTAW
jgi:tetratricopeptide (TPR) repeat protein